MNKTKISNALLSVSDKTGLLEFVQALQSLDIEMMSTGGTHNLLSVNGLVVKEVSEYTGFPEMMDGRVKTLHPKIHGGLLGRRGQDGEIMRLHNINPIDLLVVNLYPFETTVAEQDCTLEKAIENIDIGGPAMLRSAAKNMESVAVVVDIADYDEIIEELFKNDSSLSYQTRFRLAVKAFEHVAAYDSAIANYLVNAEKENL